MKELKQAIYKLSRQDLSNAAIIGKVVAVDENNRFCDVEPLNGDAVIYDVRLQSDENLSKGVVFYPSLNSNVVIQFINKTTACVTLFSEIDKIVFAKSNLAIEIDEQGLQFQNNSNDLKKSVDEIIDNLTKLYDFILKMKVITSVGPGLLDPALAVEVTTEKVKIELLKQQIAGLLK